MTIFQTDDDKKRQREIARRLSVRWRCELCEFGDLDPVDWFGRRGGEVSGVAELKVRTCAFGAYPTVFLSVAKHIALRERGEALGVPAVFAVGFSCGTVAWVDIAKVDASNPRVRGREPRPGSVSDQELIIDVPLALFSKMPPPGPTPVPDWNGDHACPLCGKYGTLGKIGRPGWYCGEHENVEAQQRA